MARGLEAAIAFHVANNLVTKTINTLSAGGLALLVPAAASLAALVLVWLRERARRADERG